MEVYIIDLKALTAIIADAIMPVHGFYCCCMCLLTIKQVIMSRKSRMYAWMAAYFWLG